QDLGIIQRMKDEILLKKSIPTEIIWQIIGAHLQIRFQKYGFGFYKKQVKRTSNNQITPQANASCPTHGEQNNREKGEEQKQLSTLIFRQATSNHFLGLQSIKVNTYHRKKKKFTCMLKYSVKVYRDTPEKFRCIRSDITRVMNTSKSKMFNYHNLKLIDESLYSEEDTCQDKRIPLAYQNLQDFNYQTETKGKIKMSEEELVIEEISLLLQLQKIKHFIQLMILHNQEESIAIQNQTYKERNIISVIDYKDNEQLSEFECLDQTDFQYNHIQWINKESYKQNIQFFQFYKQIPPHYQLEINIDFLFFSQKRNFNIFINEKQYEIIYEDESLHMIKCNKDKLLNPSLNDSDELALTKFLFTPFKDQKIEITIDLEEKNFVGIQNLYVNILPCHPTCLECSGPEENKCTKCSKNNPIDGKCSDCDNYFQDGQCVNKCDESKFLFPFDDQKQKICIYSPNCQKFDKGSCIQCNFVYRCIFNGECVVNCPIGYTESQNSNNCEIDKSNNQNGQSKSINLQIYFYLKNFQIILILLKKVIEIVNAFYNSFFSDLEVNALNIKTSQFINTNELKRVTTQCGNRKVLGGFLANKLNSQIEFEVTSNNCKNVIFYFNFIIIDYVDGMDLDSFTLQLNDLSEPIQLSSQNKYEKSNMCGDKTKEEHTFQYSKIYDIDKTKGETQNIKVKIINNNKYMDNNEKGFDKKNKHPFFGISGLTIFCIQDILCDKNCQECDQNDQNICLKCKQGFKLSQNKICIEEIKCDSDSYLDDSNKCKKCSEELQNCLECDSNKSCKKCSNSFILENEKCVCDQNSYLKGQNECVKCQDSFPNCFQCDSNSCIKCSANYQLHEKQCFPCKSDEQSSNNNCQKCLICLVANCKNCSESTDKCEECEIGFELNQQKCEEIKCEQNQFYNQSKRFCEDCQKIFENCNSCSSNKCNHCIDSFYLDKSNNKCVSNCPKGTFVNENNQCEPCKQKNCLCDSNSCLKCNTNYQLHSNQCSPCTKGTISSDKNECNKCLIENCNICSENSDICEGCIIGYKLNQQKYKCEECQNGYQLNQQKCEEIKCEQNQFYNYSSQACELCDSKFDNCNQCSQDKCNDCKNSYYLDKLNDRCVNDCPKGTYVDNKKCELCQLKNCKLCISEKECQKCEDNYQLHNYQCFLCKKDDALDQTNNECQKCIQNNCKKCYESTNNCEECENGYTLNQLNCEKIVCKQNEFLDNYEYTISLSFLLVAQLRGNSVFLLDEMLIYYTQAFIKADYGFNILNIFPNMFQVNNSSILYKINSFDSIWLAKDIFTDFLSNYFYQSILIGLIVIFLVISTLVNLIFQKMRTFTRYLCHKMLFLIIIISSNQLLVSVILQLQNEGLNKIEFFISIPYILVYISYFSFIVKQICFSEFDSMQLEKLSAICNKINQKRIYQLFWIIFEAKKLVFVLLVLILSNKTVVLIIDLILSFGFMIYVIITRPLLQQNQNFVIVIQELLSILTKVIQTIVVGELEISFSSFSALLKIFAVALICIQVLSISRGFIIFMNFILQKLKICQKNSYQKNQISQSSQIGTFNNIQLNTNTIFDILHQTDRSINLCTDNKKRQK
ncbi:hypothetical protein ABPG73_022436, partial [Tetrahymena malaccensis]